jgi:cytochrome c1
MASRKFYGKGFIGAVVALAVLLPVASATALAATEMPSGALSEEDEMCLSCHQAEGMEKTLANGDALSLHVPGEVFGASVHAWVGCAGCHADVNLDSHPAGDKSFDSARAYAAQASQVCGQCHSEESLRDGREHHARVSEDGGPACAECHDAHAITSIAQWKASVEETAYCLTCHGRTFSVSLANGETRTLSVDEAALRASVHLNHDCTNCHTGFSKDAHEVQAAANTRERSILKAEVCRGCHEDKHERYRESIHAALLDSGNLAAPVCTDCHGSHSVGPKAVYETIAGVPCKKCHETIFNAYLGSMHGEARGASGHIEAPICADCHRAHEVGVASTGTRLKDACLACHEGAADRHQAWLPNTALHLEVVSCPACHAPRAQRRIDLGLYDAVADKPISEQDGPPRLEERLRAAAEDGDGLGAMELWNLVRDINREGTAAEAVLRGRMEVQTGIEAHQLAEKSEAVRDCNSCHEDGAEPFQNVTISVTRADGRPVHYDADKEVLSSPASVDSVAGFYAIGGTRIKLLDILLLLAVFAGISVPVGHMTMRKLLKKDR